MLGSVRVVGIDLFLILGLSPSDTCRVGIAMHACSVFLLHTQHCAGAPASAGRPRAARPLVCDLLLLVSCGATANDGAGAARGCRRRRPPGRSYSALRGRSSGRCLDKITRGSVQVMAPSLERAMQCAEDARKNIYTGPTDHCGIIVSILD